MQKNTFVAGFILMALAVALGAFGAHGLKSIISPEKIEIYKTGVTYHFYHAFGILILGLISVFLKTNELKTSILLLFSGIVFFSGSLYILAFNEVLPFSVSFLGPVTPLGGLFFIAGWLLAALKILKKNISS